MFVVLWIEDRLPTELASLLWTYTVWLNSGAPFELMFLLWTHAFVASSDWRLVLRSIWRPCRCWRSVLYWRPYSFIYFYVYSFYVFFVLISMLVLVLQLLLYFFYSFLLQLLLWFIRFMCFMRYNTYFTCFYISFASIISKRLLCRWWDLVFYMFGWLLRCRLVCLLKWRLDCVYEFSAAVWYVFCSKDCSCMYDSELELLGPEVSAANILGLPG